MGAGSNRYHDNKCNSPSMHSPGFFRIVGCKLFCQPPSTLWNQTSQFPLTSTEPPKQRSWVQATVAGVDSCRTWHEATTETANRFLSSVCSGFRTKGRQSKTPWTRTVFLIWPYRRCEREIIRSASFKHATNHDSELHGKSLYVRWREPFEDVPPG